MHIICLTPLEEGVYNDCAAEHITMPPEGWAYIPEDMPLPSTFPRLGSLEAEELTYTRSVEVQTENGTATETHAYKMMTVTSMTVGRMPELTPDAEPTKTTEQRLADVESDVGELSEALNMILSGVTE